VKELHLIEGAEHAQSVFTDPEGYRRILTAFLEKATASAAHA
jgi:hypothetical protein